MKAIHKPLLYSLFVLFFLLPLGCKERTDPTAPGIIDARLVGTWILQNKSNDVSTLNLDHSHMILNQQGTGFLMDLDNEYELDNFYWAVEGERINIRESNKWFNVGYEQQDMNSLVIIEDRLEPTLYYTYTRQPD